jgi:hypothetical protein
MDPSQSHRTRRTAPTPPTLGASPERPSHSAPQRCRSTRDDASAPAERVRVTDRPACGPGRSCLVERELEQDGNSALTALVQDYLAQASAHDEVPMLRSPVNSPLLR